MALVRKTKRFASLNLFLGAKSFPLSWNEIVTFLTRYRTISNTTVQLNKGRFHVNSSCIRKGVGSTD